MIYCRRYFLVGVGWRLPHHRTRQWSPLDILFRIIARLAGPFYFQPQLARHRFHALFFLPSRGPTFFFSPSRQVFVAPCAVSASNSAAVRSPRIYSSTPTGQKDSAMSAICWPRALPGRFRSSDEKFSPRFSATQWIARITATLINAAIPRVKNRRARESQHMSGEKSDRERWKSFSDA